MSAGIKIEALEVDVWRHAKIMPSGDGGILIVTGDGVTIRLSRDAVAEVVAVQQIMAEG